MTSPTLAATKPSTNGKAGPREVRAIIPDEDDIRAWIIRHKQAGKTRDEIARELLKMRDAAKVYRPGDELPEHIKKFCKRAKRNKQNESETTYRPVEVGTSVRAKDRDNFGTIISDDGDSCTVHFESVDGNTAEVELSKLELTLQDGTPLAEKQLPPLRIRTAGELLDAYPKLRPPILDGLLRSGETCNLISASKVGKSWLSVHLGLCFVCMRPFLGLFEVQAGKVLIIDDELHDETVTDRLRKIGAAMELEQDYFRDYLHTVTVRGNLVDVLQLGPRLFDLIQPNTYQLVILDSLYRMLPAGSNENDNAQMAAIYNRIDSYAMKLNCGFVCIHHSSKGNQSGKQITDVGSGAGSMARATDTHLILRPHAEDRCVVLEAAARSFPPIEPAVLRWEFPLWRVDTDLDPSHLKTDKPSRTARIEEIKDSILQAMVHFPDGTTKTQIHKYSGRPKMWEPAMRELVESGQMEECDIPSKSHSKPDRGYRRIYGGDF